MVLLCFTVDGSEIRPFTSWGNGSENLWKSHYLRRVLAPSQVVVWDFWTINLRWAVLPFFPFCKYGYIWHDMHGCRGWGELGQTMTSGSWFMLIFKLIVSVFLDGAVVVVVVVVGFVVCFFVRWCFCCGCVTLGSSEFFVSTSLQPFCGGDVMCCGVMCDDVMGCHTGRWRCGEQGPHTGHYCRHRKKKWLICLTVGRPDSGMHLSVQSPFSGSFLCSSLFDIHIRSSYILFWCGSPRLLTWSFPSLRFIPNRFHGLSKWTEVSYNNLVCMGVVWVSEPEYHFHSVFKMLSNQSLPHVYFLKSWSMEIITTKRMPLFLPGHCPSKQQNLWVWGLIRSQEMSAERVNPIREKRTMNSCIWFKYVQIISNNISSEFSQHLATKSLVFRWFVGIFLRLASPKIIRSWRQWASST